MKIITRNRSVLGGELEPLITLKRFPVFFGCVDSKAEDDIFADMCWSIDKEGVVQLSKLVPPEVLYQAQHVDGCGVTWEKYYLKFASFIYGHMGDNVLEIGGGQGRLAETVMSIKKVKWTILDPNPTYIGSDIEIKKGFLDNNFKWDGMLDTVVFSQVLEHAYDPKEFITKIASLLPVGGKLIFAYPNLEWWMNKKYTNTLNFEHTMLLTDYHVDYLLKSCGFHIVKKVPYIDHSFFYVAERVDGGSVEMPPSRYLEYKELFMKFISHHIESVKELNERIDTEEGTIYLFGAHIFSQYLLCFGLNQTKIKTILDNSKTKQGKRLYGTKFIVQSPKVLRKGLSHSSKNKKIVILKAGIYNEEIKEGIRKINKDVIFWE